MLVELTAAERALSGGWAAADYGAAGKRLYITCGTGFSVVPVRIAAPPQLVLFELSAT